MSNRYKIIACMTVAEELNGLIPEGSKTTFLEFGLHSYPDKLKASVQEEIDRTDGVDAILLGYGMCSMSILGVSSQKHHLVIPRQHDCIGIFLGSGKKYKEQVYSNPGTYYLTKGWINHGGDPYKVYKRWRDIYGDERAKFLLNKTIGNYTRLAYIETGREDQTEFINYAQTAARELDLRFERIKGNRFILEKMLAGDWDDDFVIVEPGDKPTIYDFST